MGTVTLHWLPLGADGTVVRLSGFVWERLSAWREHRPPAPLFHSALEVRSAGITYAIEIGPAVNSLPSGHGVVGSGPVGTAGADRFRAFRYELRCWPGGKIPDLAFEIGRPVSMSDSDEVAARLIALTEQVPMLIWGRDELRIGEMWNSNSVIAWLLAGAGIDVDGIGPPSGGGAPGWSAGVEACRLVPPE